LEYADEKGILYQKQKNNLVSSQKRVDNKL
jgi:hypothetical protein